MKGPGVCVEYTQARKGLCPPLLPYLPLSVWWRLKFSFPQIKSNKPEREKYAAEEKENKDARS